MPKAIPRLVSADVPVRACYVGRLGDRIRPLRSIGRPAKEPAQLLLGPYDEQAAMVDIQRLNMWKEP